MLVSINRHLENGVKIWSTQKRDLMPVSAEDGLKKWECSKETNPKRKGFSNLKLQKKGGTLKGPNETKIAEKKMK